MRRFKAHFSFLEFACDDALVELPQPHPEWLWSAMMHFGNADIALDEDVDDDDTGVEVLST